MATIEQIKSASTRTVVSGAAMVEAAKDPKVKAFWEQADAYTEAVKTSGNDYSR